MVKRSKRDKNNKKKYVSKYRKIINELIDESFSGLKRHPIIVNEMGIYGQNYSAVTSYFIFFSWIIVHPKVRKYSEESIKAILAHELSHLDLIVNMNFIEKIKFAFSCYLLKKARKILRGC